MELEIENGRGCGGRLRVIASIDALGRKCALALDVEVIGTVGMVVAAQRRGVIADARAVLLELRRVGMWLSDDVIARALRIAGLES